MSLFQALPRRRLLRRLAGGGLIFGTFSQGFPAFAAPKGLSPLILLDPGHGGQDPGTRGFAGTLEKEVTLASARALQTALAAIGLPRVALTRTEDRYVGLEERAAMARDLGASVLISLHANALVDRSVRGASVYTLARRGSDEDAEALASRENGPAAPGARTDKRAPEIEDILASLASREVRAASVRLAHDLVAGLGRDQPLLTQPERQANFTVLHTPDIPSVLVEMGFLSNPSDEAALASSGGRAEVAAGIARAVRGWIAGNGVW